MEETPNRRQTAFENLMTIIERLRDPGGCPWDRKQTHESLRPHLIEECYELVEAIDAGEVDGIAEELGDVLTHVAFHADMARRAGTFTVDDVLEQVTSKLIRRHPHVFGDARKLDTPGQVEDQWEEIKRGEHAARSSVLDGIPSAMPALAHASALQRRAAGAEVRCEKLPAAVEHLAGASDDGAEEVAGDFLFAAVAAILDAGVDPETALRAAAARFNRHVRSTERGLGSALL